MNEIKKILLLGLKNFGKKKTFDEILTAGGFKLDKTQRIDLATELETTGMIEAVTYSLPFAIRAELTQAGKDLVKKFENGGKAFLPLLLPFLHILTCSFDGRSINGYLP